MEVNRCSILISASSQASTRQKPTGFAGRTCKATSPAFRSCPGHWWLEKLQAGEAAGFRASHSQVNPSSVSGTLPFSGELSSRLGKPQSEASATIFWNVMRLFYPHFLAWNCLPLHPFKPGLPASNRHASTGEIMRFDPILRTVIKNLEPEGILAVGKDAQMSLTRLALDFTPVRHPSHGGAKTFAAGVEEFFRKIGIHPS